jgi:hypothetical protein
MTRRNNSVRLLAAVVFAVCTARAQEHTTPGIAGEITAAKAMRWLYGNFDAAKNRSKRDSTYTWVYAQQSLVVDGQRQWYLYTWSNEEGNDCHGCGVTLGGAMFAKEGAWWVEKANQGSILGFGSMGVPPIGKTVEWGKGKAGLIAENGWIGSGVLTNYQLLVGFEGGSFRTIFDTQIQLENGGGLHPDPDECFEAVLSFGAPGPDGVFDIVVKMKNLGKKAAGYPAPGLYRYDGKVYRHTKTQATLGKP